MFKVPNNSIANITQIPSKSLAEISSNSLDLTHDSNNHLYRHPINLDNLINICTMRLKNNPNHKKALFIRASSYMKKEKYLEAIEDCHKLLDVDSKHVLAYYLIGSAHEKLGEI